MKTQLQNFLNVKYSTKKLTNEQFEFIVEDLAEQLEKIKFESSYSEIELHKDWNKLKSWSCDDTHINSTSRIGMKLCEHFFPNFYDIKNNRGESFRSMWTKPNLIKILRWNRKSHSTPYLSEIKRGIYFCCGMTKNTMYRPQIAKLICDHHKPKIVLDPCAGWGGRMLGAVASGAEYIAFEPNTETFNNLQRLILFLNIQDKVKIICDDAMNMEKYNLPKVDLIITSPPYFDLEIYSDETTQSITKHDSYDSWSNYFLKGIIEKCLSHLNENGVSCWNVAKINKNDMNDDVLKYHQKKDYTKFAEFSVISSKRQALKKSNNDKNNDNTIIYKKSVAPIQQSG